MPINKDELEITERPSGYTSPAKLLRENPDKAYTLEEIDARTRFPLTRIGLLLYLEGVKSVSLVRHIGHTRADGKEYYYWMGGEQPGSQDQPQQIPIEETNEQNANGAKE